MSVISASVQRMNLEIIYLLTNNNPDGITTYIEHSAIPTPQQPMRNPPRPKWIEDSTCFNIFPVSWATSQCPTSSIQCRVPCLNTSRSGFSTSGWCTNGSTRTMQSGYPCLFTTTSHQSYVIWGSFSMEWEGDEGNDPVPEWSCNPVSTRWKPQSVSYVQSRTWVLTGIVRILYVCSIYKSQWCSIVLDGGCLASFSHLQR